MKAFMLEVAPREGIGRSHVRKLRTKGFLPAVIYGKGIETQSLSVPRADAIRALNRHGMHALVSLKIEGGREYLALIREVQIDAVRQEALHIDFERVEEDKPVVTEVAVEIAGTPAGVKVGGVLEVQTVSVSIEALPLTIPDSLEIDVSALEIGDVARVGDLQAPEGVTILTDPEETLALVAAPRVEEEPVAATEEELEALAEGEEAAAEGEEAPGEEGETGE